MDIRISCDDGYVDDLKVASLLEKYGFTGVFYIAPYYNKFGKQLKVGEIKELSKRHEIGGHTLNHPVLTECKSKDAYREIIGSKNILEEIIGEPVLKFAYPKGWHNKRIRDLVKKAGFIEARTMKQEVTDIDGYCKFETPVTFHVYPTKIQQFEKLFAKAQEGGYFHLVLHSWEISKFGMWDDLEKIIKRLHEYKSTITE